MTILVAIAIGAGFGILVALMFKRGFDYMAVDLLIGICGAIIGTAISYLAQPGWTVQLVTLGGAIAAGLGAGFALLLYQLVLQLNKKQHKSVVKPGSDSDDSES